MRYKIAFTGGSTAGHIIPNLPLIDEFHRKGWEVHCFILGTDVEKKILEHKNIKLYKINSGKFRRYFDFNNLTDIYRVVKGIVQATFYIHKIKPDVIFSKGGYIAFPVAIGAWLNRVPFIIHESDTIPSLTTKLVYPFASSVYTGFPSKTEKWNLLGLKMKTKFTGIPLRKEFTQDVGYYNKKGTLLILGGSLGSTIINACVRSALKDLLKDFNIIHICGAGKIDTSLENTKGYKQYEFVNTNFSRFLKQAQLVLTRGGATTLYELLYLKKPMLIVPLSRMISRGDQISNAHLFKREGYGDYILEEQLTPKKLAKKLKSMRQHLEYFVKNMNMAPSIDSNNTITNLIISAVKQGLKGKVKV